MMWGDESRFYFFQRPPSTLPPARMDPSASAEERAEGERVEGEEEAVLEDIGSEVRTTEALTPPDGAMIIIGSPHSLALHGVCMCVYCIDRV